MNLKTKGESKEENSYNSSWIKKRKKRLTEKKRTDKNRNSRPNNLLMSSLKDGRKLQRMCN
jgi:hypothetical protein